MRLVLLTLLRLDSEKENSAREQLVHHVPSVHTEQDNVQGAKSRRALWSLGFFGVKLRSHWCCFHPVVLTTSELVEPVELQKTTRLPFLIGD